MNITENKKAFTLIELLVVIAIIALLLAILMPALKKAKNHAMTAVCLSNLKQLTLGWMMYADANEGKIPTSDISFQAHGWVDSVKIIDSIEKQKKAIRDGMLWPHVENLRLYKCPTGKKDEVRTYSMVGAMNSYERAWKGTIVKNLRRLSQPGTRAVFIDEGKMTDYAFMTLHKGPSWRDPPPVRHNNGVTLSFADGHSEHWKWQNQHTIDFGTGVADAGVTPPDGERADLVRVQRALWGKLGYVPTP
jgi:prepilin-type N-terminal cleavage/methylation domain-containing protein/prepilin-type processing-associated H-X9-DG protein